MKDVTVATYPPLEFSNIQSPHKANMTNNGHTVMINSMDSDMPMVSGGPLNDTYVFQQLHFHWGENDKIGSEDLINNHSFSMELHAVFWKKSYNSSEEAMKHSDGLTVLAYLYQAKDEPNPIFDSIVPQIPEIATVGSSISVNDPTVLNKLIAPDSVSIDNYFTYRGSLTTPPCLEIVQWIDFTDPQSLSHEQLAAFRGIQSPDGSNLTHNFRPVQPLDGRMIYRNSIGSTIGTSKSTSASVTPGTTISTTIATTVATTVSVEKVKNVSTVTVPTTTSTTMSPTLMNNKNGSQHSGQERTWIISYITIIFQMIVLLPYQ